MCSGMLKSELRNRAMSERLQKATSKRSPSGRLIETKKAASAEPSSKRLWIKLGFMLGFLLAVGVIGSLQLYYTVRKPPGVKTIESAPVTVCYVGLPAVVVTLASSIIHCNEVV